MVTTIPYPKVKITVTRRLFNKEEADKYTRHPWTPCSTFKEGQEFISDGVLMPEGFCSWAWSDIEKQVMTLSHGGNFSGCKEGVSVACCSDGFRPVIFVLERMEPIKEAKELYK